jgi:uncharacterized protein (DUF433 family)
MLTDAGLANLKGLTNLSKLSLVRTQVTDAGVKVLDPKICFGKPIVEKAGIATAILAGAFHANSHDAGVVADWYGVQQTQVLAAVDFERSLVA